MSEIAPFHWTRTSDLRQQSSSDEIWTLTHGKTKKSFDVSVTFGKAIDIKGIKKTGRSRPKWNFATARESTLRAIQILCRSKNAPFVAAINHTPNRRD